MTDHTPQEELRQTKKIMARLGFQWNQWRRCYGLESSTAEISRSDAAIIAKNYTHALNVAIEAEASRREREARISEASRMQRRTIVSRHLNRLGHDYRRSLQAFADYANDRIATLKSQGEQGSN